MWIWGKNGNGELGVSDYEPRAKPFPLVTLDQENVLGVFPGVGYACCICEPHNRKKPSSRRQSHFVSTVTESFNPIDSNKGNAHYSNEKKARFIPAIGKKIKHIPNVVSMSISREMEEVYLEKSKGKSTNIKAGVKTPNANK